MRAETTEGLSQGFGVTPVETFSSNIKCDYKPPSNKDVLKLKVLPAGVEGWVTE